MKTLLLNVTHYWCAAIMSETNRTLLNVWTNTPPFAGNVLVGNYQLGSDNSVSNRMLATNGLSVYPPPFDN